MSPANTVSVKILDKEYKVACPPEQEAELTVSAKYLDKQMRGIRDTGKVIGLERIAVMAALNISYELLQASEQQSQDSVTQVETPPANNDGVRSLSRKLDDALYQLRQLEIN